METKRLVGNNVNVILTRQTCGQSSHSAAENKRRALAFCFIMRIRYMFWASKCRVVFNLGLCTALGLAKRMPLRSADFQKVLRPSMFFNWKSAPRSRIFWQIPKSCTDLDLTLLYILTLGTCSRFARKNKILLLGVCFPHTCTSAGRMFAASRPRLHYYQPILSFPQQRIWWNASSTEFYWESAVAREIPNPTGITLDPRQVVVRVFKRCVSSHCNTQSSHTATHSHPPMMCLLGEKIRATPSHDLGGSDFIPLPSASALLHWSNETWPLPQYLEYIWVKKWTSDLQQKCDRTGNLEIVAETCILVPGAPRFPRELWLVFGITQSYAEVSFDKVGLRLFLKNICVNRALLGLNGRSYMPLVASGSSVLKREREGMQAKPKRGRTERFFDTQPQKKPSPSRMAQTPRAGTGDSVGWFHRHHWSTLINYNSNLSMCGTFLQSLLTPPDIRDSLSTPKRPTIWIECSNLRISSFRLPTSIFAPKKSTIMVWCHPLERGLFWKRTPPKQGSSGVPFWKRSAKT